MRARLLAFAFVVGLAAAGSLVDWAVRLALAQPTGTNTVPVTKVPLSTVNNLPTCNAGNEGLSWGVTDANAPTALSNVAGSGAVHVRVYCNNTNWIVQ